VPSGSAGFDGMDIKGGEQMMRFGCDSGHFNAASAKAVGDRLSIICTEMNLELAERSWRDLDDLPQVGLVCANGNIYARGPADCIIINSNACHPCDFRIDRPRECGTRIFTDAA